ncbi:MAG: hypothetical protein ACI4HI_16125 [Lachnospiraceae bacterium]
MDRKNALSYYDLLRLIGVPAAVFGGFIFLRGGIPWESFFQICIASGIIYLLFDIVIFICCRVKLPTLAEYMEVHTKDNLLIMINEIQIDGDRSEILKKYGDYVVCNIERKNGLYFIEIKKP